MNDTISAFLSMQNALTTRRTQLSEVKNSCTSRSIRTYGETKDVTEPTYDIKDVDKKITEINKVLFRIDSKIKESNARTKIEIDIDFDVLMSGIG